MVPVFQREKHSSFSSPSVSLLAGPSEKLSSLNFHCLTFSFPRTLSCSRDVQEVEEITAVLQHTVGETYVAPSTCQDLCEFHQTSDTPASTPEEQAVSWILDADGEYTNSQKGKAPHGLPQSLLILYLSCLCGRSLSLLQTLQIHLS